MKNCYLLLVIFFHLSNTLLAQPPAVAVAGRVKDQYGRPVPDARVWATDQVGETYTDIKGEFLLHITPGTSVKINIQKSGYSLIEHEDRIIRNNNTLGDFSIQKQSPVCVHVFENQPRGKAKKPVAGAVILINGKEKGRSQLDGTCDLPFDLPDTFMLSVQKPGYQGRPYAFGRRSLQPFLEIPLLPDLATLNQNYLQLHNQFEDCLSNLLALNDHPKPEPQMRQAMETATSSLISTYEQIIELNLKGVAADSRRELYEDQSSLYFAFYQRAHDQLKHWQSLQQILGQHQTKRIKLQKKFADNRLLSQEKIKAKKYEEARKLQDICIQVAIELGWENLSLEEAGLNAQDDLANNISAMNSILETQKRIAAHPADYLPNSAEGVNWNTSYDTNRGRIEAFRRAAHFLH